MYKYLCLWFLLLAFTAVNSQELNCNVTVNSAQIQVSNSKMFKTLENSLTEFMNQTQWTSVKFQDHEKIKCGITILLTEQKSANTFSGTLQIQASRPVFNSTYYSPLLNSKDDKFTFQYTEFQPLIYNKNGYESNLISVMSYYAYLILGMYVDTFTLEGGTPYLNKALTIANQAQQSGSVGWENSKGDINRFTLVDNMLSTNNDPYRKLIYEYHFDIMDSFEGDPQSSTYKLFQLLLTLNNIYDANPNSFMIRTMMNTKSDEIVNIFKQNSSVDTSTLVSMLKRVSTANYKKWRLIDAI